MMLLKPKPLHDFYLTERDLYNENIVYIVHPWESGLDNAPLWDEPLAAIRATSKWAFKMQRKYDELAEWIEDSIIALALRHGFYEYYDPDSGRGLGEDNFSWTAALVIDLISRKLQKE